MAKNKSSATPPPATAATSSSGTRPNRRRSAPPPLNGIQILVISPIREDHEALQYMLCDDYPVVVAANYQEAIGFLCRDRVPVIFCDRDLPDGTWKDILGHMAELPEMPALVVTSKFADEALWGEVLNLGGFDVLAKPFREMEVKHVLEGALRQAARPPRQVLVAGAAGFD